MGSYGQFDHAADILYTGNTGTWHFTIPDTVNLSDIQAPFFRASLVSDDHGSGISNYTYSVATNGTTVAAGETGLPYGSPGGSTFNNWVQRDYSLTITGTANNITLTNTSAAGGGDWIAVDWIELHLPKSAVVPAPSALLTALMGAVPGATLLLRRRRK